MKKCLTVILFVFVFRPVVAQPTVGDPAIDFSLPDTLGNFISLSNLRGFILFFQEAIAKLSHSCGRILLKAIPPTSR